MTTPAREKLLRCPFCETLFEEGVADPTREGEPRCPQCGLTGGRPEAPVSSETVITCASKFR